VRCVRCIPYFARHPVEAQSRQAGISCQW
jgi:hypothetical protein